MKAWMMEERETRGGRRGLLSSGSEVFPDVLLPGCDLKTAYFWGWEEAGSRQGKEVGKTHPQWVTSAPSKSSPAAAGRGRKGKRSSPHANSL